MMFLSDEELEKLTGYEPNQRRRICAWLDERGIPHTVNRLGDPVVLRSAIESPQSQQSKEPDLSWLQ